MGLYTRRDEAEIDTRIEGDLRMIVDAIIGAHPDPVAVYLTGGFGRGEGTVSVGKHGWAAVNDYDLLVVGKSGSVAGDGLKGVSESLAVRIGIPFVDIGWISEDELVELKLTMDNYDLRHGARLLFGEAVLGRMPRFQEGYIPPYELLRLLSNRAAGLLTAELPKRQGEARYGNTQITKALIAIGDVAVGLTVGYHHLYSERLARFEFLRRCDKCPDWLDERSAELICTAYRAKLSLSFHVFTELERRLLPSLLARAFCVIVKAITGCQCNSLAKCEESVLRHFGVWPTSLGRRLYRCIRRHRVAALFLDPVTLPQYVLLTQVPMYVAHQEGPMPAGRSYIKRYCWVSGALRRPHSGIGAVQLWEQYVH